MMKKSSLYLIYSGRYDNFSDFMAAILNFAFLKKLKNYLRRDIVTRLLEMHNQSRKKKTISAKAKLPPLAAGL